MDEAQTLIMQAREQVRDHCLNLLSDAVYRRDDNAKLLERQAAKISRALDKALHEIKILENMNTDSEFDYTD